MNATKTPSGALSVRTKKFQDLLVNPESLNILELDPSSSGNNLRGAGQLEYIDGEWVLALRHVHRDILPYIKQLYVWFRVANKDFDIYEKLEALPTTIEDYDVRIRFLISAIEDLEGSDIPDELEGLKGTIVHFYKEYLEIAENIHREINNTRDTAAAE